MYITLSLAYLVIGFLISTYSIYKEGYYRAALFDKFILVWFFWPLAIVVTVLIMLMDLLERYIKWILK